MLHLNTRRRSTWAQPQHLQVAAAIQRHVPHLPAAHHRSEGRRCGFQRRRRLHHLNLGGKPVDRQLGLDVGGARDGDLHVVHSLRLEERFRERQRVLPKRQVREQEVAEFAGDRSKHEPGILMDRLHGNLGDGGVGRIHYRSRYSAVEGLCP